MKLILVFVMGLIGIAAYGQTNTSTDKRDTLPDHRLSAVGVYIGYNGTYTAKDGISGNYKSYATSFMYGAFGVFDFRRNNRLQIETGLGAIEYASKYLRFGYSYNLYKNTFQYQDNLITSALYVTVPMIFKYKVTHRSYILSGIRASGQVTNNEQAINGIRTGNNNQVAYIGPGDLVTNTSKFDIGLIIGYEYHFSKRVFVSLLYNFGLIPLFSKSYINHLDAFSPYENNYFYPTATGNYNNSISIRICYNFLKY